MSRNLNPFEHHHGPGECEHDHGHDHGPAEALDPAQQSLADAMRVSFGVLKAVIAVLLVLYLASGFFSVPQNEVALRLRFGAIVGEPGQQVITADGRLHWSWPYPIEQIVRMPAREAVQQTRLDQEFYFRKRPDEAGKSDEELDTRNRPLSPERDGSLLTADRSIIHAQWNLTYAVENPVDYVRHVGDAANAQRLVRRAVEEAIVATAAHTPAQDLWQKTSRVPEAAARLAQAKLDRMATGLSLKALTYEKVMYPLEVRDAPQAVGRAQAERARLIDAARTAANQMRGRTIGDGWEAMEKLVTALTQASLAGRAQEAAQLRRQIDEALAGLSVRDADGRVYALGGEVSRLISDARAYQLNLQFVLSRELALFRSLLPAYRAAPQVVVNRLWDEAREQILAGDVLIRFLPAGAMPWIKVPMDPEATDADAAGHAPRPPGSEGPGRP